MNLGSRGEHVNPRPPKPTSTGETIFSLSHTKGIIVDTSEKIHEVAERASNMGFDEVSDWLLEEIYFTAGIGGRNRLRRSRIKVDTEKELEEIRADCRWRG